MKMKLKNLIAFTLNKIVIILFSLEDFEMVTKLKLLGVFIGETLSWMPRIDYLCSLMSTKIFHLNQLAAYVPHDILKMFYQSYRLPLLDYGCNTWVSTSCANIERLSKLQKRSARIILQAEYSAPSATMFQELGRLSILPCLNNRKSDA